MADKIRWGIVGPGHIAHSFAKDLALVDDGELTAVASRSLDRANEFADTYGAKHRFGSYGELFTSDVVDVLYIATPHTAHYELAIDAMNNKKAVLVEKPMGIDADQVKMMMGAAKENEVFMMEALWSRFNPSIEKVKSLIDAGEFGDVSFLSANFGFYALNRDENGRLLNPDLAGGSLLDIGIYPIFLAYLLLGKPDNIEAASLFYKTGVEIQTSMIFEYPQAQATLVSGLRSKMQGRAEISGTKGSAFLRDRWHEAQGYSLYKDGVLKDVDLPTHGLGYTHEIDEVHNCLRKGMLQSEKWTHNNSLDLANLLDEVRNITGTTFPFEE